MEPLNLLEDHILIIKNLPKQIDNLAALLNTPATEIKPFGKRRILLHYDNGETATEQLKHLDERGFTIAKYSPNKTEGQSAWKPKVNSTPAISKIYRNYKTDDAIEDLTKKLQLNDGDVLTQGNSNTKLSKNACKSEYNQRYTHIVAIDFEATCWEKQASSNWRASEIIEFPAVLYNLKKGKIEAEFHKYITPQESPKLSSFCTELTGISQEMVDNGVSLPTAITMFHDWLRKELRSRALILPKMSKENKKGNCAIVSWTDWDFGICLAKECRRKRLKKPQFFNQWIDIRVVYRDWYDYRPLNFNDALEHAGLTFEGRLHSGIDDAKNLAALTHKLIKDGATLAITKDLTPFQLNLNSAL